MFKRNDRKCVLQNKQTNKQTSTISLGYAVQFSKTYNLVSLTTLHPLTASMTFVPWYMLPYYIKDKCFTTVQRIHKNTHFLFIPIFMK